MRTFLMALCLLCSGAAHALTLDEARAQGRLGETLGGYVAAVAPDAEAEALAAQINAARRERYQQLAARNHVSLESVAGLAGQKLVERAPAGQYVRGLNGLWLKK
ncbi:YdbL family protein [Nissabacter sp. SGAir0207]|uniref:YdbL family protein n=1 Tax=Nissabacter sp. SGAir0207 TaxID=2126321 RepID=UPI0010CCB1C5|nr:YdbL family protein [Nissabacter sp. SGAir0207]QCR36050.1 DUF1318 domain-containing protein [Nissabacter sp. SGAir0207]